MANFSSALARSGEGLGGAEKFLAEKLRLQPTFDCQTWAIPSDFAWRGSIGMPGLRSWLRADVLAYRKTRNP